MKVPIRILLVDKDQEARTELLQALGSDGYEVYGADGAHQAKILAKQLQPNIFILDVSLDGQDGISLCYELRNNPLFTNCIVIFLTERNEEYAQLAGFEAGGDDYIFKPIRIRIIKARIRALLKRQMQLPSTTVSLSNEVLIDTESRTIQYRGNTLDLPKKQFDLLLLLGQKKGKVFSRDVISSALWNRELIPGDRSIDVHVRKIREKLGDQIIDTVKGVGYRVP